MKVITDLPRSLNEASGLEKTTHSDLLWMINDGGNKPVLYGLDTLGTIKKHIKINAKNRDWEDLAADDTGNIYIGNFGNNSNDSKNLSVLIINNKDLDTAKTITPKKISFTYPEQKKFPPKNKKRHFDCESFFYFNDSLYLFTKSRSSSNKGRTNLYQIPTKPGKYEAKYISSFSTCNDSGCWVTSADINDKKDQIVLLTEHSVFIFSNFKGNDFLNGDVKHIDFKHRSQKESVIFKNDSTLLITDEYLGVSGGNLYQLDIH
ncbi:hypothetical protein [Pontimicrobium sp. SW4]|uniref:Uncharacterized protein n=1 Tax=Pontimicrobium sp. SW4 TaxID=3153519 RepID=A0AAU7BU32_9FLAO